MTTTHTTPGTYPAPYKVGRNGTGYLSKLRKLKSGAWSVVISATGKAGQPLWQERRTFTPSQIKAAINANQ
jgi:hypothetical protein